ncbi:MAG: pyruvate formate lyase family protein, partial [Oscillospiraceae bacterium]|nr:pyruvate formate lyase family protein [Oscillospiraceae bacterium]
MSDKVFDSAQAYEPPLAIEPVDREWGVGISGLTEDPSPFPRINKMLRRNKETDSTADAHRAVIVTECFEKYAMYPQNIKWALALREVYERVPVHIWEGELIVGELAAPPNSAPVYPEFSIEWLCDELENRPLDQRKNDRYVIDEQTKNDILSIRRAWKGKTLSEATVAGYTEDEARGSHLGAAVLLEDLFIYAGVGHVTANYEKLLRIGFGGIRREIEGYMASLDTALPEDIARQQFYTAELIMLDGVRTYISRYGTLARELANAEPDAVRRAELVRVASNCLHVAEGAPRDFWEAIQLWHIATNMIIIETSGHSVTYGRFDKIFYPFYRNDVDNGTLTREFMQELIEHSFNSLA